MRLCYLMSVLKFNSFGIFIRWFDGLELYFIFDLMMEPGR